MRADGLNGEVEHLKVQVEIARNDSAQWMADLNEVQKISKEDQGAESLLQIAARNAERLLDSTAQRFRARREVALSETNGKCVSAIREILLQADNSKNAEAGFVVQLATTESGDGHASGSGVAVKSRNNPSRRSLDGL